MNKYKQRRSRTHPPIPINQNSSPSLFSRPSIQPSKLHAGHRERKTPERGEKTTRPLSPKPIESGAGGPLRQCQLTRALFIAAESVDAVKGLRFRLRGGRGVGRGKINACISWAISPDRPSAFRYNAECSHACWHGRRGPCTFERLSF